MFFPVLIDRERSAVVGTGDVLPIGEEPNFDAAVQGYAAAWPIRKDGTLGSVEMRIANRAEVSPSCISNAPELSRGGRRSSISRQPCTASAVYAVFVHVIGDAEQRISHRICIYKRVRKQS